MADLGNGIEHLHRYLNREWVKLIPSAGARDAAEQAFSSHPKTKGLSAQVHDILKAADVEELKWYRNNTDLLGRSVQLLDRSQRSDLAEAARLDHTRAHIWRGILPVRG